MKNTQDKFFILVIILLMLGAAYLLAPILTPFLVGTLLAYLVNPIVEKLVGFGLPRILSVILVFLFFLILIVLFAILFIPFMEKQIDFFIESIPKIISWIQDAFLPLLTKYTGFNDEQFNLTTLKDWVLKNWTKAGGMADWIVKATVHSGFRIAEWLINLLLIPVVAFYLLCDWNRLLAGIRDLLPRRIEPTAIALFSECDEVLNAFFRGQLLVMLALAVIYSLGLTLIGLQVGLLVGLVAGLLSIVPYLGFIVGIITASIAAFVQWGSISHVILTVMVFIIGHLVDHVFLTPRLVGDRIGLHPVAVIFAILAGGSLFGFLGVLLALPVAALIMVWIRYLHVRYQRSDLYK